ncbi:MAG: SurA N-terminal domain-containing protein [Desulfobacterales bacterium]|nr:SurA N-terminal domain-containing protein [Desulfobacterales bacterium]
MGVAAGLALILGSGCTDQKKIEQNSNIIKAGTVEISRENFVRELEIKLANYPYDIKDRPREYNAMVLDLVSDLSDEAVLLAAAAVKAIDVSAEELEAAVADFKKDYPEDSFDRMLLERAISYPVWKKRLEKDMVIQKLIMEDLVAPLEIHPEDVIAFYDRFAEQANGQDNGNPKEMDETNLVLKLRMEKSQEAFGEWLQGLQNGYPVHIDKPVLSTFLMNAEEK